MRLTDKDKRAVAILRSFAADYIEPDGLHGPVYRLGGMRLYMLGIVKDASRAGFPERQVLVFSDEPRPEDKLPDIPVGCAPHDCVFAVLRRRATPEERDADKPKGATNEDLFTFELLEFKGRSDGTVFFAGSGIRSRCPTFS